MIKPPMRERMYAYDHHTMLTNPSENGPVGVGSDKCQEAAPQQRSTNTFVLNRARDADGQSGLKGGKMGICDPVGGGTVVVTRVVGRSRC